MIERNDQVVAKKAQAIQAWNALLVNQEALLLNPGARHKMLIRKAHAMRLALVIDRDDLCDLLEQADGALEFAMEALHDLRYDE